MKNKEKNQIVFRMAARCEAAGRPQNEDNYQIDENLSDNQWGFTANRELPLGEKGALLVVCDGMGGMNAGEVASAIAVRTIKEWFVAERLTDKIMTDNQSVQKHIVEAIQAADAAIKADATRNPEHQGMGSTIVMAWMLGQKLYVGWCGDSRCYCYNPKTGLKRLSHDHSYVQELVDAGRLTEELAFDHPNNNIITRSLGDPRGKAQPDTKVFDLCNEDIILLCSDGLCGCLRDNEIETVIRDNQNSMQQLRDALWQADEAAGWHDNVTIALAQVLSGAVAPPLTTDIQTLSNSKLELLHKNRILKSIIYSLFVVLFLIIFAFCRKPLGMAYKMLKEYVNNKEKTEQVSTTPTESDSEEERTENVENTNEIVEKNNSPQSTPSNTTNQSTSRLLEKNLQQMSVEQEGVAVQIEEGMQPIQRPPFNDTLPTATESKDTTANKEANESLNLDVNAPAKNIPKRKLNSKKNNDSNADAEPDLVTKNH